MQTTSTRVSYVVNSMACNDMMTWSDGNIFRVTGHLCGEFTGPGEFPHKGQWSGALMISLICVWINGWVNNREAGDLRRYLAHYDVIVMTSAHFLSPFQLVNCETLISVSTILSKSIFSLNVLRTYLSKEHGFLKSVSPVPDSGLS